MEHHAPHARAVFEGYYSKFDLPSGAHLALISCQVRGAEKKPYMLSFTYVPQDTTQIYQKEIWAEHIEMTADASGKGFRHNIQGVGFIDWNDEVTEYNIEHEHFTFKAKATNRTPWSKTTNTPESLLVHLPLPLHWHVHSLASDCAFDLEIKDYQLPEQDRSGKARVHDEKNWAISFPSAHSWLQAREEDRGFCCAGGQILGMEAFLLGYRSKNLNIDFRPPFAVRIAGWSPFLSYKTDWENRKFELSVQNFRNKLTIEASAPKGSFFSLSSPFPEGHRENFLGQSFQATFKVKVFESGLFSPWKLVREDHFESASLEFGAGYYPPAGSAQRFH
ncbi:hypothetical protein CLAFUW4_01069 [Fulvia fulva]|nr:hypothetical protein CLAFUR4_01070 [Fulvia fulva]WPV08138.1 hypothetical protein CLAFUW4_01069 [Fulvia fulva]WPV23330.1 hypothetical protein CLAFUW7_01074 [Fulvia fulva]